MKKIFEVNNTTNYRFLGKPETPPAEIRVRLGDWEHHRLGYSRYEKLRKLSPRQFADLYQRNLNGEGRFDDLVDKLK